MSSRKIYMGGVLAIAVITACASVRVTPCVNKQLTIECPMDNAILIISADYGHPAVTDECTTYNPDDCSSFAMDVWALCHHQNNCSYVVPQNRNTSCEDTSRYLSVEYDCQKVSCLKPTTPAHGSVSYSAPYLTLDQTATYTCEPGYQLSGPMVRTCRANSNWTGFEPSCSIFPSECPMANHSVTFGSGCFDIVETSSNWTEAKTTCSRRGWQILTTSQGPLVEYLLQEVLARGWRGNLWAEQSNGGQCVEWIYSGSWSKSDIECSYLNRFICMTDIDTHRLMAMPEKTETKDLYIILGAVAGIFLLLVVILVLALLIRKSLKSSKPSVSESRDALPGEDMYYDDAASATSASDHGDNTPPCSIFPRYSIVDKSTRAGSNVNEATDYGYDPVCAPATLHNKVRPSYENTCLPSKAVIGSLKKRLQQSREGGLYVAGLDQPDVVYMNGTAETPQRDHKGDTIPANGERAMKKPKPAPKPILPNYLEKPLNNQEKTTDAIKRPTTVAPRLNITSELELMENELYDDKPNPNC